MGKAMVYTDSHWNSVVGSLVYADENGVLLLQLQNPFEPEYVVRVVDYAKDAMLLIDQTVCVYAGRVFRLVDDVSDRAATRLQGVVFSTYEQAAVHQDLSTDPREEL